MKKIEIIDVAIDLIPVALTDRKQWVCWRGEPTKNGRLDKKPVDAKRNQLASTTDSSTWASFSQAESLYHQKRPYLGLGFVFSSDDPLLGIDLDNCRHTESGQIEDWAQQLIASCNTYSEVSPSGSGVKLFMQGEMPGNRHKAQYQTGAVEMYDCKRFFTVTGQHLTHTPKEITENPSAIKNVYEMVFAATEQPTTTDKLVVAPNQMDDQALIEKAIQAQNGNRFRLLWQGDWDTAGYPSASEADLALASCLAFWTQRDYSRIENLMRQSGLNRDKYQRADYMQRTIHKACQTEEVYDPECGQQANGQTPKSALGLIEGASHYYRQPGGDEGTEKQISSFIVRPKLRVWLDKKENTTVDLITRHGKVHQAVIQRQDWNSKERFMNRLPSLDLQWYGTQFDVQCLQSIVANYQVEQKQGTDKLGCHHEYWVWPDSVLDANGLVTDPPLVYLPAGGRGELDDKLKPIYLSEQDFKSFLQNLYSNLLQINRPEVVIPAVGWMMATAFKTQLGKQLEGFPILSVAGTRGAGKSTFLRLLWQLMGAKAGEGSRLFSCTETDFVMLKLLSSSSSIPIIFDEYKPYDMPPYRLKSLSRLLRKAYDGVSEFRGRPDQTTTEYALTAPVAMAGEVSLSEGALLERIIAVEMSPNHLTSVMRQAYTTLRALPLQAFMTGYIPFVLQTDVEQELIVAQQLLTELLGSEQLPDRVNNNLTIMVFGFKQFMRFCAQKGVSDIDYRPVLRDGIEAVKGIVCGQQGVTKLALDYLLEHLATMAETGKLQYGIHYKFDPHQVSIRLRSCLAEFRRYHRETQLDGELLDEAAYRKQIRENMERKSYITDSSDSVRFSHQEESHVKRAVQINLEQAEAAGLDLSGFIGSDSD